MEILYRFARRLAGSMKSAQRLCAALTGRAAAARPAQPHKKVHEGKRDTNFTPRCCLFDYLTRSRPHKKVRKGKRDTNFTPLNRSIHSSGSLLAAEGSGHQPPHKNVCGETCDKTLPEAILAGRAQRPNPPKTRRASGSDGKGGGHSVQHCAILDHSLRQCD